MSYRQSVEVMVDGRRLAGEARWDYPSEFTLIMSEPYQGLGQASRHVPYFAMRWHRFAKGDTLTEHGVAEAQEMLRDLYLTERKRRQTGYLQDTYGVDLPTLRAVYAEMEAVTLRQSAGLADAEYHQSVEDLKRRRRAGDVGARDFVQRESALRAALGCVSPEAKQAQEQALRQKHRFGGMDAASYQKARKLLAFRVGNYRDKLDEVWAAFCATCQSRWKMSEEDMGVYGELIRAETPAEPPG